MTAAIERVVAPATQPITLLEAKDHLRIMSDDEDDLISGLIAASVSHVDCLGDLGRAMITQTWAQWERQSPGRPRLRIGPNSTLIAVDYYDADGVLRADDVTRFELWRDGDHMRCKPKDGQSWPEADTRPDAIKLTYTAGFGAASDVPQGIKHALLMLVAHLYENREAVSEAKLASVPMGYEMLMTNERLGWYG